MGSRYWVRRAAKPSKIRGPISEKQLRRIAVQGKLRPHYQVSTDLQHWIPARELKALVFASDLPAERGAAASGSSYGDSHVMGSVKPRQFSTATYSIGFLSLWLGYAVFYFARLQTTAPDSIAAAQAVEFVFFAVGAVLTGAAAAFAISEHLAYQRSRELTQDYGNRAESLPGGRDVTLDSRGGGDRARGAKPSYDCRNQASNRDDLRGCGSVCPLCNSPLEKYTTIPA